MAYALATIIASSLVFASGTSAVSNVDLLSQSNLRIDGPSSTDRSGYSVTGAGDVNGDGRDDVIVGAYFADKNGRTNSGSSYVVYGAATQTTIDLNALTQAQGFRIDGAAANDYSGYSVAGAGDVNGDGLLPRPGGLRPADRRQRLQDRRAGFGGSRQRAPFTEATSGRPPGRSRREAEPGERGGVPSPRRQVSVPRESGWSESWRSHGLGSTSPQ